MTAVPASQAEKQDRGLLHYFLGIRSARQLETHPARGASWEAFVVDQLLSAYRRRHPGSQAVPRRVTKSTS